ncbi:MAG: LPS assembly protein LptD [Candidatus Acidiferrales bacterium]
MLGFGTLFDAMPDWMEANSPQRNSKRGRGALLLALMVAMPLAVQAGTRPQNQTATHLLTQKGELTLEADSQRESKKVFFADGHVDIVYAGVRLRADHVEYNQQTKVALARGHVQFDHENQHLDADNANYNFETERGTFYNVRGTVKAEHFANPNVLVSPNPLTFAAAEVERVDEETFVVKHAWLTVCKPDRPKWKFYAPRAVIHMQKSVRLDNATFHLFHIPVIYLPYASVPAGEKLRQSGFLIPDATRSSTKGYVLGDSYYWAPTEWMDATVGAQYLSLRGSSENGELRMKPWENATLTASYYGVIDRGIPGPDGTLTKQGGHEDRLFFDALLPGDWRAVADIDQLSSLTFRLAFAETFAQAVNSEVRTTTFLTKHTDGFSLALASLSYKNFLTASPDTSIDIRTAPEIRASSVDRAPWQNLPIYFSFDAFADAVHRETDVAPEFSTPSFVSRMEFAPTVTAALHWGPWLDVTPTFTVRSTRYGGQLQNGEFVDEPFVRTTAEFSLDVRPPALERTWSDGGTQWRHTIEPEFDYEYVDGVNDYARYPLFDEDDTLTDTNDVQYGITQRLFRRTDDNDSGELVSWSLQQKYYIDPTFGGALVPGQRNVFQALDSLTPFAFEDSLHRFSPIISDLRVEPGGHFDTEVRVDFDPKRGQMTAIGTLLKIKPYKESFLTLAHFSTINIPPISPAVPPVEPYSNQVRALVGYGDLTRRGWNSEFGFSYDISEQVFQNQIAQISYNGSCCGIGFEYRRLSLGPVRNENQFGLVFRIANIGSFGNVRRQESIF